MTQPWDPHFERLLRDVLPKLSEVTGDTCLRGHGLDSLATVELLLRLEETYQVSVPDTLLTADNFATPAALWAMIGEVRRGEVAADGADRRPGPAAAASAAGGR
ncbi:phosphopantetheine-binding protein [Micromonospora sp. NPDC050980]|uniref:phosphopantetheine-binding protein n=1 Tax=Micromonospora sp. NPDC050980 TaxID=3155161 RepID=UPI0033D503BE